MSEHKEEGGTRYDYWMHNRQYRSFIPFVRKTKIHEIIIHFTRCRFNAMRESVFGMAFFHSSGNSPVFLLFIGVKKTLQRYVRRVAHRGFLLIYSWKWRMTPRFRTLFKFVWLALGAKPPFIDTCALCLR